MADYDFRGQSVGKATIAASKTFHLDAESWYTAELSGDDGGATAVNLNYQLGDGTYEAYADNPGETGKAIGIKPPVNGVVQVEIDGGSNVAVQVAFRKTPN